MNCHFLVTSILFVDFTYLILVFTFKSACVFHIFTWMISRSLSSTQFGPAYLIEVRQLWPYWRFYYFLVLLFYCVAFDSLLFVKLIIWMSGNTFLCPLSDAKMTCSSSNISLTSWNTGLYVMLKVILHLLVINFFLKVYCWEWLQLKVFPYKLFFYSSPFLLIGISLS